MWQLLADLAAVYCEAATWALAARDTARAKKLVERARVCLDQRGGGRGKRKNGLRHVVNCN
jgi:hypothetical protein